MQSNLVGVHMGWAWVQSAVTLGLVRMRRNHAIPGSVPSMYVRYNVTGTHLLHTCYTLVTHYTTLQTTCNSVTNESKVIGRTNEQSHAMIAFT